MGKREKKVEEKKDEQPKKRRSKKTVEINVPEEVTEGIIRISTGFAVKHGDRKELFEGDTLTALNEAIKRYRIFLTE